MAATKIGTKNSVYSTTSNAFKVSQGTTAADSLTVESGGYLISTVDDAVVLDTLGAWTLKIDGTVMATAADNGIALNAGTSALTITVGADGTIAGGTHAIHSQTTGATTVTNAGVIQSEQIGIRTLGKTTITNSGSINAITFAVIADGGAATLKNTGVLIGDVSLQFDGAANSLTNSGVITGDITFGDANDKLTNSDFIESAFLDDGNNVVTNSGTIGASIVFGIGDDTFTNSGAKSVVQDAVDLDEGNNKVTNAGTIDSISASDGIDQVSNSGSITGLTSLGDNADKLTNSGKMSTVGMGSGNDIVNNTGTIDVLDLGDGDDTYNGGAKIDSVADSNGEDVIKLGASQDDYTTIGAGLNLDGDDKIDGGTGLDLYNATGVNVALRINLDTVNHNENFAAPATGVVAKNSAAAAIASPAFYTDNIIGFELVFGGTKDDVIYGNAAVNSLYGQDGNDQLAGFAGNDTLVGGNGQDRLLGGAGSDRLYGNSGDDAFIYNAASDSAAGISKRDLIDDFTDTEDEIILTFDANTTAAGNQGFTYINGGDPSANFTGAAGELRTYMTLNGWMVEADTNGDAKADLQIEVYDVDHLISWSGSQVGNLFTLS